ncbi:MAG: NAD(P)-binding domain-containing protein, partial [Planctomycetota bacterium]
MGWQRWFGDLFYRGEDREILVTPVLDERFETTRKRVHLIGELNGTPLLKHTVNSGQDVVDRLTEELKTESPPTNGVHLCIVGAGPAGVAAAIAAKRSGLSYRLIERDSTFATIRAFHKGKPIFTEPQT